MQGVLTGILIWAGLILVGVAVGRHFGTLDGLAAAGAVYCLMPQIR
jgi:hypothetical protein